MKNNEATYSLTLALLMVVTFMSADVRQTLASAYLTDGVDNTAAVINATSATTIKGIKCPAGYTCTPNPVPSNGVTAKTSGNPKLVIGYDSNKKEALLTATFDTTVDGGKTGVYVSQYPWIDLHNTNGDYAYANGMNRTITPISKVDQRVSQYGEIFYWVPANRQAKFAVVETVNPKVLFAGTYYATLTALIGYPVIDYSQPGYVIYANSNQTNSVTIIGEVTPYISNISPYQAYVGDRVVISGQRLTVGSSLYIDGVASGVTTVGLVDGTALKFDVPTLSTGWHAVAVGNSDGMSNVVGLEVLAPVSTSTGCYTFTTNLTVGSTGADVVALQTFLITNGFHIPSIESGQQAKGYFDSETATALSLYQTSVGLPATGFVGPLTAAKLNGSCGQTTTTPVCPPDYVCTQPTSGTIITTPTVKL